MRFGFVDLVMLPAKTLSTLLTKPYFHENFVTRFCCLVGSLYMEGVEGCGAERVVSYLSDAHSSPFILPKQLQRSFRRVMIILWDGFEHSFGKLHVTVFVFAVRVSS